MAAHCLPGRIRIDIPGLKGSPDRAARFEAQLRAQHGVTAVTANPVTGRALIYYEATPEVAATVEAIRPLHQVAGLSTAEASRRLRAEGPNTLKSKAPPSFISRLTDQFKDPMVATLLGGAGLSLLVGRVRDALTITAIVLLNAFVGASQAGKAEGALDALRRMAAPRATAVRDGRPVAIPAAEVVPGDLLLLEAGDKIPADARISVAFAAQTDESMLTGESLPVAKAAGDTLFAGTTLTGGRCSALVTGTGMRTEMGRIARLLGETQEGPTPLQTRMEELGKTLVRGSLWVCAGVVVAGILRRLPTVEMFLTGVSLAVAAIPEGLPTFVTLGLATGVRQMARRKALVRRLQAVETLGNATYICTDKTGTLTANAMTVRQIYVGERWFDVTGHGFDPSGAFHCDGQAVAQPLKDPDLARILNVGAICNNASLRQENGAWSIRGDATEGALLVAAAKAGLDPVRHCRGYRRMLEVPFDSGRRRMTVVCEGPKGTSIYTKGAPEAVLAVCTHALRDGRVVALTEARRRQILNAADAMAGRAYRVLATATRPLQDGQMPSNVEHQLIFLGLLGLMDPPRPEVPPALERCRRAGIKVLMLTGDHPRTAEAVAREIGL
ncbi:MAG TPA: HAD-IC family P-type ATPase, partial [Symbiobacteriaceae bacterium]|nr:HAD-IC family P-type ATPase [Symbiobacteriaceae bacterium]